MDKDEKLLDRVLGLLGPNITQETVDFLNETLTADPELSGRWLDTAMELGYRGDYDRADDYFKVLYCIRQGDPCIMHLQAINTWLQGRNKSAAGKCRDLIKRNPGFTAAHLTLANAEYELGHYGPALRSFDLFLKSNPDNVLGWCGKGMAQRAWAEPPRDDQGEPVCLVHVETDFLRNVADTDKTYEELDTLQIASALSAFIYLPAEGKIRMHSTMYLHGGNYDWASRVLLNVAGVQLLTSCGAQGFEAIFEGSQADTTPHPVNGLRGTPDEMVRDLGGFYRSAGKDAVAMPKGGFEEAGRMLKGLNVLAFADETGLGAEFHFVGDSPAVARHMAGKTGVETSLYMARVDAPHRVFGNGLVSLMTIPAEKPPQEGHRWCNRMNLAEAREWTGFHMLGTWLSTPNGDGSLILAHRCFLPAFPLQPELVLNLALCGGLRSKWASGRLGEGE